jgi:hypothetical protein
MHSPDRLRRPFAALFASELRNVGFAVLREAALAAVALAVLCILLTTVAIRYHEPLPLVPEILLPALPLSLLVPWAVWKGDPPFGHAYLWTLPVHRQQAAAAKVAAGAVWLVVAMIVGFLMLAATALASGGTLGVAEVRLVGPVSAGLDAAARVRWSTPLWGWLVPFGGAVTFYLLSSAALLGLRHPVRWVAALALGLALLVAVAVNLPPHNPLEHGLDRVAELIVNGRWGLDVALTGGHGSLAEEIDVPGPGSKDLWTALPTASGWAASLAVWFGAALLALALALRRHWER